MFEAKIRLTNHNKIKSSMKYSQLGNFGAFELRGVGHVYSNLWVIVGCLAGISKKRLKTNVVLFLVNSVVILITLTQHTSEILYDTTSDVMRNQSVIVGLFISYCTQVAKRKIIPFSLPIIHDRLCSRTCSFTYSSIPTFRNFSA